MKTKVMAAFVASCTAWLVVSRVAAVEPLAVWNGDFSGTQEGFVLDLNGNAVQDGAVVIGDAPVKVRWTDSANPFGTDQNATKVQVLVKYSNFPIPTDASKGTVMVSLTGGQAGTTDYLGTCVIPNGVVRGIWNNSEVYTGSPLKGDNTISVGSDDTVRTFVSSYTRSATAVDGYDMTYEGTMGFVGDKVAYGCAGLKANYTVGDICIGGKAGTASVFLNATGMKIHGIAVFNTLNTPAELAAYEFPAVKAPAEPLMLVNFCKDSETDGWFNYTQSTGSTIPTGGATIETNGLRFATTASGNFFNNNWTEVGTDFAAGSYTDVFGRSHDGLLEEIKASLGLDAAFPLAAGVYKTGLMNGGKTDHTATISGLTPGQKYVIYYGFGLLKTDGANQTCGMTLQSSHYASVGRREYVVTVAGSNTSLATTYTEFGENVSIKPGQNGLMVVRLTDVIPTDEGTVQFTMTGERGGINFLAVAQVNAGAASTTAEFEVSDEISISSINGRLRTTDTQAVVNLADGSTVLCDAAPSVNVKLVSSGAVTLSAASVPDHLEMIDVTGVQGTLARTWLTSGFGFNFNNNNGGGTDKALEKTTWLYDANNKDGTKVAATDDGLSKITWTSNNLYTDQQNSGTILHGYLDDSAGVNITVSGIPFREYAVIIYSTTDTANAKLSYKTVNGTDYTADGASDVAVEGTAAWGSARSSATPAYGTNALRIVGQTAPTLVIHSANRDGARGCISAIQIVPYTTFVEPTATLGEVTATATSALDGNTVSGTLAGLDRGSWTGEIKARVTIGETVHEAAVAADGSFSIAVTGLARESVYRPTLQFGYESEGTFRPFLQQAIALYQGEQTYVWTDAWVDERADAEHFRSTGTWTEGIALADGQLVVDRAEGVTFTPNANPDYVALCDSEFEVTVSAAEAVDAACDQPVADDIQGGVRMVKVDAATVKLQFLTAAGWTDGSRVITAGLDEQKTVKVRFHYAKDSEDAASSVSYLVDDDVVASGAKRAGTADLVGDVLVADGTRLGSLKGICELDRAVVVDVMIEHAEEKPIAADSLAAAQLAADRMVVAIAEEVARVVDAGTYRGYFRVVAREVVGPDGKVSYVATVTFADQVREEIEEDLRTAMARIVEGFSSDAPSASFSGKPGLYYGLVHGDEPTALTVEDARVLAGENGSVSVSVARPEGKDRQFYRVICSPMPREER